MDDPLDICAYIFKLAMTNTFNLNYVIKPLEKSLKVQKQCSQLTVNDYSSQQIVEIPTFHDTVCDLE